MGNFKRTWSIDNLKMDTKILLSLCIAVITFITPAAPAEPRVVCYYTNWSVYRPGTAKFNPQNINPYLCTHLIYAFGGFTKENTLKPFDKYQDIEKGGYAKFTGLKTYNKNLKTLLAIGGWNEGSSRFSPMVASRERRKEFVRNAIKFLRQNRFDGLDLDWEYPAFRDGGKPKDRENYAKLVKELREEFEREAEKTGKPRLLLTMAVPAGIEYIEKGFDVETLNRYLDWMNLLSYDYHSAFEPAVNHHAPLYPLEEPNEYSVDNELNIDYTIKFYLESGADRDKIVLGIPTYGRSYTLFNADAVEIGSPADGPGEQGEATREKGYLAYYEICEALKPKTKKRRSVYSDEDSEEYSEEEEEEEPWTVVHPNSDAMGPVAYKGNQWVGYDDVDIVKKKAEYAAENGLGGIMFWSIDNDDFRGTCHDKQFPLIEAAKEAYYQKLTTVDKNAIQAVSRKPQSSNRNSSNRRRNRPKTSTTTSTTTTSTTTPKSASRSNKRNKNGLTSTTPAWNVTPEPPTTPDPGTDFKCVDEGFYQHPRDCKKYFWCLDSGPSNLGIVAHQFTCPSGLYFNKAADSCDFARNVLCKKPSATTKAPITKPSTTTVTTTTTTTTTRRPVRVSTRNSILFRTSSTTTTTPEPETEEEYEEDVSEDNSDIGENDAEDPKVIKELIDLIKKVGGIEQLEKQLRLGETPVSTNGDITTTQSSFNKKLYQKVLERTRGRNKIGGNSILDSFTQNSRRGPQNEGLEPTDDKDKLLRKDRPQYTTINRQRSSTTSTTEEPLESDESDNEADEPVQPLSRSRAVESERTIATTAKPLQYVNIRRAKPTSSTSDTADDSASRNALFERPESYVSVDSPSTLDIASARRENVPEYVTIRRQRPSTEETTTLQYNNSEDDEEIESDTALEREISSQPQYTSIARTRSPTVPPTEQPSSPRSVVIRTRPTTPPPEEPSGPEPTTVLAVQISSFLNSLTSEFENPEPPTTIFEVPETTSSIATTTTTTAVPSSTPTRRTILRRRPGPASTTTSTPSAPSSISSSTQAPKRGFQRRTKATSPPEIEDTTTPNVENTNKFTRRGGSKFKSPKVVEKTSLSNNTTEVENGGKPSLNGGARRNEFERPAKRGFVRRRQGGANAAPSSTSQSPASVSTTPQSSPASTRRAFRIANRKRVFSTPSSTSASTTTTTPAPTTTSPAPTTTEFVEESVQDIGDTDAIEEPSLEPRDSKKTSKVQKRPLLTLKDTENDQNPSATNEEEKKRQSKKYSSTFRQNQLESILRAMTTEGAVTDFSTTAEELGPETALAIAAFQLLTAPLPSTEIEESTKPIKSTQQYKYTNTEYTDYTNSQTPNYEDSSYRVNTGRPKYSKTPTYLPEIESPKIASIDYEIPNPTSFEVFPTKETKTGISTLTTDYDTTRLSTYEIPKPTYSFPPRNTPSGFSLLPTDNDERSTRIPIIETTEQTLPNPSKGPRRFTYSTVSDEIRTPTAETTRQVSTNPISRGFRRPSLSTNLDETGISTIESTRQTYSNPTPKSFRRPTISTFVDEIETPIIETTKQTYNNQNPTSRGFRRPTISTILEETETPTIEPTKQTYINQTPTSRGFRRPTISTILEETETPTIEPTKQTYINQTPTSRGFRRPTISKILEETEAPTIEPTKQTYINQTPTSRGFRRPTITTILEETEIPTIETTKQTYTNQSPTSRGFRRPTISTILDETETPTIETIKQTSTNPSSKGSRRLTISTVPEETPSIATLFDIKGTDTKTVTEEYFETTRTYDISTSSIPISTSTVIPPRSTSSGLRSRQRFSSPNIIRPGYSGVSPIVPTDKYGTRNDYGYSTAAPVISVSSQDPSLYTRDYLLESPITKAYDEEYQYLLPVTSPQPPPPRKIRKKLQRRISTTLRPTISYSSTEGPTERPLPTARTTESSTTTSTAAPRRTPSKKPFEKIATAPPSRTFRPIVNYDYYDDSEEKVVEKYAEGTKVVLHGTGSIECLDIGNFPHPSSCKKFISCARMESGSILGWEYICPKGLSFDPVGGICNWSAGLGCVEKDP